MVLFFRVLIFYNTHWTILKLSMKNIFAEGSGWEYSSGISKLFCKLLNSILGLARHTISVVATQRRYCSMKAGIGTMQTQSKAVLPWRFIYRNRRWAGSGPQTTGHSFPAPGINRTRFTMINNYESQLWVHWSYYTTLHIIFKIFHNKIYTIKSKTNKKPKNLDKA